MKKNGIKFVVAKDYKSEEILIGNTERNKKAIEKANAYLGTTKYEFEDTTFCHECIIEFDFRDGIALATDGCGLYLSYPTLEEVANSVQKQNRVQDYIGIYDGTITQYDIALAYGVLKFAKKYQK